MAQATRIFGLSAGAIAVLAATIDSPAAFRVALYEPPIPVPGELPTPWFPAYQETIANGDLATAFVAIATGTGMEGALRFIPRFVLTALFRAAFSSDDREALELRELVPTMEDEVKVVLESTHLLDSARSAAPLPIMGASRNWLRATSASSGWMAVPDLQRPFDR